MKKHFISLALCLTACFCFLSFTALAASPRDTSLEETLAADLKALNLFQGVSDREFELDRAPTRVEALIMLIRVLGKETEALSGTWSHPFTDVPAWANAYVGYAYENGLTNGSSATKFGTGDANAAMYLTFVLRSLGYSDAEEEDFVWDKPFYLAEKLGILPDCVDTKIFLRADVVSVSYAALNDIRLKGSSRTLTEKLIDAGVFTQAQFSETYDADAFEVWASQHPDTSTGTRQTKHFEWTWRGHTWSLDLQLPIDAVTEYKNIPRDPYAYFSGYTDYVSEPSDDVFLFNFAQLFVDAAAEKGWSRNDAVGLAVSFVQNLVYLPDDETLGYDYPKYPLETLYDGGGDCEDSSILLASVLRELGYACSLLVFEEHMGVGILGDDTMSGYFFRHGEQKYYYIETTYTGWEIGDLPDQLINQSASVFPV